LAEGAERDIFFFGGIYGRWIYIFTPPILSGLILGRPVRGSATEPPGEREPSRGSSI